MNEQTIPVFFNTDNNYIVPTYIAMFSMLYNYCGEADIHAYVLTAGDFSEKNAGLLEALEDMFDHIQVHILDIGTGYDGLVMNQKHVSAASMYRLSIPRIADDLHDCPMDKCIYLDSDLVVEGDLSKLFAVDVEGYYIAGVGDGIQGSPHQDFHLNRLEIPSLKKYINAGVLVMNLKEINQRKGLREKLEEAGYNKEYLFNDQDAINVVLRKKIKLLPMRFNAMPFDLYRTDPAFFKQYKKKNIKKAKENPVVIHYITEKKPWLFKTEVMAKRWWNYVEMQDQWVLDEYIDPFLKENRVSMKERAQTTGRTILKHLGVYYKINKKWR